MKLSQLIKATRAPVSEAISNNDIRNLDAYGYAVVDQFEVGDYNVALTSMPDMLAGVVGVKYQLGFSKTGTDFTDHEQHNKKFVTTNEKFPIGSLSKGMVPIRDWVSKYGELAVASSNPKKTRFYDKLFTRAKFNVRKMSNMGYDWIVIS